MYSLTQASAKTRAAGAAAAARPLAPTTPRSLLRRRGPWPASPPPRGLGDNAVGGFLDLAKLVSGHKGSRSPYDDLAFEIGRDVYADVGGWHLFLRDLSVEPGADAKMAAALANALGPRAAERLTEREVEEVLARVPVRLGNDKRTVPLSDLVPRGGVRNLTRLVEEWGRRR